MDGLKTKLEEISQQTKSIQPKWHNGHWVISFDGKDYRRSCLMWLWETGVWPIENPEHIDGDITNDNPDNLRVYDIREDEYIYLSELKSEVA